MYFYFGPRNTAHRTPVTSELPESKGLRPHELLFEPLVENQNEKTLEQRYPIKFCCKVGNSPSVTFELLQRAYGDDCMSYSQYKK